MRLKGWLCLSCATMGLAAPAMAQDAKVSDQAIVVTGSRVIKNGNSSPTPLTVVSTQDIAAVQPTTIADGLNLLPVFSSPRNQYANPNGGVAGGAGGNAAANQLNLRNMGSVRNLILFDGHRVPSTSVNNIVDVDMIPQMLVQRVETVTGGVSAVYGSDAVTGVVNFITDRKFNGLKMQAQGGLSTYGDGAQYNAGLAWGKKLGERGHFEMSYEYRKDEGVSARSSRPWFRQQSVQGGGTAANPYQLFSDIRINNLPFGGAITSGALAGNYFATNGVLSPSAAGTATGSSCCTVGGTGGYYDSSLKAKLESHQLFGRLDYELGEGLNFYVSGLFNNKKNEQFITPPVTSNLTMSAGNAFLAPSYQNTLAAAGQSTFLFSKLFSQAPRLNPQAESEQFWVNLGLDGKLGAWDWSVAYSNSASRLSTTLHNNVNNQKLAAALDAVTNSSGQTVCYASTVNSAYAGCAPLNLFGPSSASQAALDYITGDTHLRAMTKMQDISGSLSGSPFKTWAGDVNVALSGEWRLTSYASTSDALPTTMANCTGLRYNCSANTVLWQNTYAARSRVSNTVGEVALEAKVPLLKDLPFADALDVTGALRYTSYRTSGQYWTWKLGIDWHLSDKLRFRATRSRDIRAPTLDDLYAPSSVASLQNRDELTKITPGLDAGTSPVVGYSGGNSNLRAEVGNTLTAGLVWKPANTFSVALDGYRIKISDAITSIQGYNPTIQNACYSSGGTSPYCALQSRPLGYSNTNAANLVTAWYSTVINIAEIETWGADLEANWATKLAKMPATFRFMASWQPHIYYRTPALVTIDQAGAAFGTNGLQASPKWRLTAFARLKPTDRVTVDIMERWRGAMKHSTDPTQVWANNHVAPFATTNLNVAWKPKNGLGDAEVFLNVQNLFNAAPPATAFFGASTIPGQFGGFAIGDDPIGRYFTAGVRLKM
jgi:iron complex outermembrane receptor protein